MEKELIMIKRNIKKFLNNHKPKISQKEIGELIGVDQSRISKILSEEDNSFIRVDQLIMIANHFDLSLDELAGRTPTTTKKQTYTMRDIISALFELEKVDFDINERQTPGLEANPLTGEPYNTTFITHDISFRLNYLDSFLADWKEVRNLTLKNDNPLYKQVYESWKKDKLNAAANESLSGYSIEDTFMDELDELPFN